MPKSVIYRVVYIGILAIFLLLGTLYAWRVPDWQAPDEPAHYNYIAQVASGEFLPVIEIGDWNNDYLETLKATDFDPTLLDDLDSVKYENHQPPLYYWVATPFYVISDGSLFAVRMVSVLLATITVALTFSITQTIFPERPYLAIGAMLIVAFIPQNLHILASVNNDALAGMMVAVMTFLAIKYLNHDAIPAWALGLAMGITFITKTTAYFMAGVLLLVLVLRWLQTEKREFAVAFRELMGFGVPSGIFALLYWGRNIATYGFPDFLGLQAHDEVVVGQQRRVEFIELNGINTYWEEAFYTTYNSFWGQFGWMEARLADALPTVMVAISVVLLFAMTGLIVNRGMALTKNENDKQSQAPNSVWIMFAAMLMLAFAQYIYYNITFVQFQGRYLFVAIIPFAILMMLGLETWRSLVFKDNVVSQWVLVGIIGLLAPLNLYLIWRVIPCAVGC